MDMKDHFGREIEYLRLSVTDKCNLNCSYCKRTVNKERGLISFSEIERIVRLFSILGIHKIRLTGGEPLVREDLSGIIRLCKNTDGIREVALTTNGILLAEKAETLKKSGLDRVNISIDSLDQKKYKEITRANSINKVLEGIDAAIIAGLNPVKINVVLIRGVNDDEIDLFIDMTKSREIEVRFIEYMPMGGDVTNGHITESEVVGARPYLKKYDNVPSQVANRYQIDGYQGKIGFISPVSRPFCETCNRIRVTADCKIRYCLGNNNEVDLREILQESDQVALKIIKSSIIHKPQKGFCSGFTTNRGMGNIGG